jgi:tetratricopeptide (TPR) repeat protein
MRKRIIIWTAVIAALAILGLVIVGGPLIWCISLDRDINSEIAFLKQPSVYEPVARILPLYCQSDPNLIPTHLDTAWFPAPLRDQDRGWGNVTSENALIEMGGGFCHFGYTLKLDKDDSSGGQRVWRLFLHDERSGETLLSTARVNKEAKLSENEIVNTVTAGYDSLIASKPTNPATRQLKIEFLLGYGRMSNAVETCSEWVKNAPNSWQAQLTHAHLRCRSGQVDQAAADFTAWVDQHPSFPYYVYLALFNTREGRPVPALAAIRHALDQPFVEPPEASGNKFYLAHNAAVIAFVQKDYKLSRAMCEKALADDRKEDFWRRKLLKLLAAISVLEGDKIAGQGFLERIPKSEQIKWGLDEKDAKREAAWAAAVASGDIQFLKDYANWKDDLSELFAPIDEDRVKWRPNSVSLYPNDWKKNAGF